MEACSGSLHIGRQLSAQGHEVRLIPAQYVKPFIKGHKNDFVAVKTPEQMDLLALHRALAAANGQARSIKSAAS
jgi:transposase